MEKPFFIEEEAIWRLGGITLQSEQALLEAFDRHREQICAVAVAAYAKRREGAYTLTAADFT